MYRSGTFNNKDRKENAEIKLENSTKIITFCELLKNISYDVNTTCSNFDFIIDEFTSYDPFTRETRKKINLKNITVCDSLFKIILPEIMDLKKDYEYSIFKNGVTAEYKYKTVGGRITYRLTEETLDSDSTIFKYMRDKIDLSFFNLDPIRYMFLILITFILNINYDDKAFDLKQFKCIEGVSITRNPNVETMIRLNIFINEYLEPERHENLTKILDTLIMKPSFVKTYYNSYKSLNNPTPYKNISTK